MKQSVVRYSTRGRRCKLRENYDSPPFVELQNQGPALNWCKHTPGL